MVCRGSIRYAEFKFQTFEQAILKLVFKSMTNPIKLRNILTKNQKKKLRILQNVQTDYLYLSFMKGQSIKHN